MDTSQDFELYIVLSQPWRVTGKSFSRTIPEWVWPIRVFHNSYMFLSRLQPQLDAPQSRKVRRF